MENNISAPSQYTKLGKKVFWLFFMQMCPLSAVLLIVSGGMLIFSFQNTTANLLLQQMQPYGLTVSFGIFFLFLISLFVALASAWLTYISYTFLVADDALKIKRGIFSKTEIAIPYRQIQNVDIEINILFRIMGLSRLIILTAGHEDINPKDNDEAEGIIPAIDSQLALWLQTELLKRADVQKVVVEQKTAL